MIQEFSGLNQDEQQLLVDAIPLVTILIAGADGQIDLKEIAWAERLTEIRGYTHPGNLNEYYELVGKDFPERLEAMIANFSTDTATRQTEVSNRLAGLNAIFPKLEFNFAHRLYSSLTSFAEHVAKSSGGFLGFSSVSKEEAELVNLPMIDPVAS